MRPVVGGLLIKGAGLADPFNREGQMACYAAPKESGMANTAAWAQRFLRRAIGAVPALSLPVWKLSFGYLIPFNRTLGMTLASITHEGTVTLRLAARAGNRNAAGTVHGGAIMALAESVHGAALSYGLREKHVGCRIFTKRAELVFSRKASSNLHVVYRLEPSVLAEISTRLQQAGKTEISLTSTVRDDYNEAVATLQATYHISWRSSLKASPRVPEAAARD